MTDNISASANVNWKEFQDKLTVLKTAGRAIPEGVPPCSHRVSAL